MDVQLYLSKFLLLSLICSAISACGGGSDSSNSRPVVVYETVYKVSFSADSSECTDIHVFLESGADTNENGILDDSEILDEEALCQGEEGRIALIEFDSEPMGENCTAGGQLVTIVDDDNNNDQLDLGEVFETHYVCRSILTLVEPEVTEDIIEDHELNGEFVLADESVTYQIISQPEFGALQVDGSQYRYSPQENFYGNDQFVYEVLLDELSVVQTVHITISPENDIPTTTPQSFSIFQAGAVSVQLQANDVDGDELFFEVVTPPSNGTFTQDDDGLIQYQANIDFVGEEVFYYRVFDGEAYSAETSIDISIRSNPPIAYPQNYSLYANSYSIRQLAANDIDGDSLSFELVESVNNGELVLSEDGYFQYQPNTDFIGEDSFLFRVFDGHEYSTTESVSFDVSTDPAYAISDLHVSSISYDSAQLDWFAIDSSATGYDIRYSNQEITEENWSEAIGIEQAIIPALAGSNEQFGLTSLEQNTEYYFAIKLIIDGVTTPISNVVYFKTLVPPQLSLAPVDLPAFFLEQKQEMQHSFVVNNSGGMPLSFAITTQTVYQTESNAGVYQHTSAEPYLDIPKGEEDLRPGNIVGLGSGGPDVFGYRWIDSNEVSGPRFDWLDIRSNSDASLVSGLYDDVVVGPIDIGFEFDFYGETFSELYISSNGFITFDDSTNSGCCSGQPLPVTNGINNIIAWLWRDLHPRGGEVHYLSIDSERFVIQFSNYGEYSGAGVVNAEIILHRNGDILLQYLNFENGIQERAYSIGIGNEDATDGLQVAFNTPYLEERLAILISDSVKWVDVDVMEGTVAPGGSQVVTLDYLSDLDVGEYSANINIQHNDPLQTELQIPVSMTITEDLTPPPAIQDLSASAVLFDQVELNFTALSDSGLHTERALARYDIRYSTVPLDDQLWESAMPLENLPWPKEEHTREAFVVEGLLPETQYYFGVRVYDRADNYSEISNVASVLTPSAPVASLDVEQLNVTLAEGQEIHVPLSLFNDGGSDLNFSLRLEEPEGTGLVASSNAKKTVSNTVLDRNPIVITQLPPPDAYKENELIVRFKSSVNSGESLNVRSFYGAELQKKIDALNMEVWRVPTNISFLEVIQELNANPNIVFAEPNYHVEANYIPGDPRFNELWGLHNIGQGNALEDADIDAVEAWDITTGDDQVIVAVIDTGIDYLHADLVENMWTNEDEIPGNGIDDDENGFVDDVHGYDFYNRDGDPADDNSHGTHVAGTIGARGDNAVGVVGVSHRVSLMAVKFLSSWGGGDTADAVESVIYAVDNGADILNNSWGGGGFSEALRSAIEYAQDNDVLFVAAAGNAAYDNDSLPSYPASYELDNIVAVAATDSNDELASFSQWGLNSVDLGAPGVDILSALPGDDYATYSGTSMASPHVAGAAALLKSHAPSLSSLELKQILMESGDSISPLIGRTVSGRRLNIFNALLASGPAWVQIDGDYSGGVVAGERIDIDFMFSSLNLEPGDYVIDLLISSNDPENPQIRIPIVLTVTPDIIPPEHISDLFVSDVTDTQARIQFTATGDDGSLGQASSYDVRFSTELLTQENWGSAIQASGEQSPGESGTLEDFTISGLTPNSTLWLGVRAVDNVDQSSEVSNVVQVNTLNADLSVTPEVIPEISLANGEATNIELTLSNVGEIDLDVSLHIDPDNSASSTLGTQYFSNKVYEKGEEDLRIGRPVLQGSGGSDLFGYHWIDSNEPGGPVYSWTDISEAGILLEGFTDDTVVGPVDIGFDFPFYGEIQNQIYVSSNGFITFSSSSSSGCCAGQRLPSPGGVNQLIAWMWYDLHPRGGQVYYQTSNDGRFVLQFSDYGEFSGSGHVDAQLILDRNGQILLQYKEFRSNMNLNRASIGIENTDGSDGLQVAFNTAYLENELAIQIGSHWLNLDSSVGSLPVGESMTISLELQALNLVPGRYESLLVIRSNDSNDPEMLIPIVMTITE